MTRTLFQVAVRSLFLLHAVGAVAHAQEAPRFSAEGLRPGDPVRAYAPASRQRACKGRFEAVRSDSLVILSFDTPCSLPLSSVEQVDRRVYRESDGQAMLRGGFWGGAAMVGFNTVLGCATGACFDAYTLLFNIITVPPAVAVGSIVGLIRPKEWWETVWRIDQPNP